MAPRLVATFLLLASISIDHRIVAAAEEPTAKGQPGFRIVGYLPEYRVAAFDSSIGKYVTDVIFFSLRLAGDGNLERSTLTEDESRVLRVLREQGVRVHVSLGGGDRSEHFAEVAADATLRARLAKTVAEFADRYQLSGIDVDWEFPRGNEQYRDFASLLAELKSVLLPAQRELSIAVAGWQDLPEPVIDAIDLIHLMAYDGNGRHSTCEYAVSETERLINRGVPAGKICLGMPFYGRHIEHRNQALSFAEIVRRHQPAIDADEVAGYYFNGSRTLERKVAFAREKGLAGVMIWELGQDAAGTEALLPKIKAASTRP